MSIQFLFFLLFFKVWINTEYDLFPQSPSSQSSYHCVCRLLMYSCTAVLFLAMRTIWMCLLPPALPFPPNACSASIYTVLDTLLSRAAVLPLPLLPPWCLALSPQSACHQHQCLPHLASVCWCPCRDPVAPPTSRWRGRTRQPTVVQKRRKKGKISAVEKAFLSLWQNSWLEQPYLRLTSVHSNCSFQSCTNHPLWSFKKSLKHTLLTNQQEFIGEQLELCK